jgi:hypothetical protein
MIADRKGRTTDVRKWHEADIRIVRLSLGIAFQPTRMVSEIPLAILSTALRVAATSR